MSSPHLAWLSLFFAKLSLPQNGHSSSRRVAILDLNMTYIASQKILCDIIHLSNVIS